jgi:hypothetical protein
MKVTKISVLISKKVSKDYQTWSSSIGATAELESGESLSDAVKALDAKLKEEVNASLGQKPKSKLVLIK